MASERFAGYFARKQTHLHKLAIVLSAAKRSTLMIEEEDLIEANTLITELEVDMQQVFSSIGVSQGAKISTEVLALIRNSGEISLKQLWQMCFATVASKDFNEAVTASVDAGYVKVTGPKGDRTLTYVGPKIISPSSPQQQSQPPDESSE